MTITQQKALAFIFCEPITEDLWNRLMIDKLTEEDVVWELFEDRYDIREIAIDLEQNFKEVFDLGYQRAYEGE
jgi:hypothetical protein